MPRPRHRVAALGFFAVAYTASAQLAEKGLLEETFQRHATYTPSGSAPAKARTSCAVSASTSPAPLRN